MTQAPDLKAVLDLELPPDNDAGVATVRGYLVKLLTEVWSEEEDFDGKRPFGNSGWQYDLYGPLIRAGFVAGQFDEHGYIIDCDDQTACELILAAIGSLA